MDLQEELRVLSPPSSPMGKQATANAESVLTEADLQWKQKANDDINELIRQNEALRKDVELAEQQSQSR